MVIANSLSLIGGKWSFVIVSIGEDQCSVSLKSSLLKAASVCKSFRLLINPFSIRNTVFEISLEYVLVMENYSTLALEVSHAKVSRTNIAIITSENSNPINGIHIV